MAAEPHSRKTGGQRAYVYTVVVLDVLLAAAGYIYGDLKGIVPAVSTPIIIAFLAQAAMFLLPGFPGARAWVERALTRKQLAALLVAGGVTPYLLYSIPLGLFSAHSFLSLLALAAVAPVLFIVAPPKQQKLTWQDCLAVAILVAPVISGLTGFFEQIFAKPESVDEDIHILGKLMVFSVGAMSFLSLRRIEGAEFYLIPSWNDLRIGAKHLLYYLPIGVPVSLALGFVTWAPPETVDWLLAAEVVGKALGIYIAVALGEELCFRGILQNLLEKSGGRPFVAQAIAALTFGAVHLSSGFFPNWGFTFAAAIAGWFYGNAFRETRSVVPAAATHTFVVVLRTFLFR